MMQGAIVAWVCRCCSASGGVCREILLLLALLSCQEQLWVLMFVGTGLNRGLEVIGSGMEGALLWFSDTILAFLAI